MKKLLGLQECGLTESEICRRLRQARIEGQHQVEFFANKKKVTIGMRKVSPDGMMRGYTDYWEGGRGS